MYIETVSQSAVAVCLFTEDLESMGVSGALGEGAARELIRRIQKNGGETPWEQMEIELFSSEGALLIIARPTQERLCILELGGAEELIGAALSCGDNFSRFGAGDISSSLYLMDGAYFLVLQCPASRLTAHTLEFGELCRKPEDFFALLREHGECIAENNAVAMLKSYFS